MLRTLFAPLLAFLAGVGALKAAIPLESIALMGAGLLLTGFGLVSLFLRERNAIPRGEKPF